MTSNRWLILAVLFFARLTMAFQFQSVAALSPLLVDEFGIGLAEVGFLIGLYFAPGVFFALPGGAIAGRVVGPDGEALDAPPGSAGPVWIARRRDVLADAPTEVRPRRDIVALVPRPEDLAAAPAAATAGPPPPADGDGAK